MDVIFASIPLAVITYPQGYLGVPRAALLGWSELAGEGIAGPDALVGYDQLLVIWDELVAVFPDEPLGMRSREQIPFAVSGVVRQVCAQPPTLGASLGAQLRFMQLLDPRGALHRARHGPQRAVGQEVHPGAAGAGTPSRRTSPSTRSPNVVHQLDGADSVPRQSGSVCRPTRSPLSPNERRTNERTNGECEPNSPTDTKSEQRVRIGTAAASAVAMLRHQSHFVLVASISLAACGGEDYASADSDSNRGNSNEGPGATSTDQAQCLERYCSREVQACDASCRSLFECTSACTTDACHQDCAHRGTPSAISAYNGVVECYVASCANPSSSNPPSPAREGPQYPFSTETYPAPPAGEECAVSWNLDTSEFGFTTRPSTSHHCLPFAAHHSETPFGRGHMIWAYPGRGPGRDSIRLHVEQTRVGSYAIGEQADIIINHNHAGSSFHLHSTPETGSRRGAGTIVVDGASNGWVWGRFGTWVCEDDLYLFGPEFEPDARCAGIEGTFSSKVRR